MLTAFALSLSLLRQASGGGDSQIEKLHSLLRVRFESTADGKFGMSRLPSSRFLHPENNADRHTTRNLAPPATADESLILRDIDVQNLKLDIYGVSRSGKVRGPIEQAIVPNDQKLKAKFRPIALRALNAQEKDTQVERWQGLTLRAKAIYATDVTCGKCHDGVKKGDRVGAVVYVYGKK